MIFDSILDAGTDTFSDILALEDDDTYEEVLPEKIPETEVNLTGDSKPVLSAEPPETATEDDPSVNSDIKEDNSTENIRKTKPQKNSSPKAKKKKKHRKKKSGEGLMKIDSTQIFSPVRDVRDGIIITKDGHFVKILEFTAINFLLRSEEERDSIAEEYAGVIKMLPDNAQFKVMSRKANIEDFIGSIEERMKTEPSANVRKMQKIQIQLIRKIGSAQGISRRFFIIFRYENKTAGLARHLTWEDIRSDLDNTSNRIISAMSRIGNNYLSLNNTPYTLEILYSIFSKAEAETIPFKEKLDETIKRYLQEGKHEGKALHLPVNDLIAPTDIDINHAKYLVADGMYYSFAYIPSKSYPTTALAGWTSIFTDLGKGIDVDIFLSKEDAHSTQVKLLYALRLNKLNLKQTEDTSLDYEDKYNAVSSGYYLKNGMAGGDDFCYMSMLLTVTDSTLEGLQNRCNELKEFCFQTQIPVKFCDFMQEQAFISSLPLCNLDKNIFSRARRNILSHDFASSYPFSSYEVCDKNGILFGINTTNNTLAFINPFDDSIYANANLAIFGMSGSGKTFTLQTLAMRMREDDIQVFIICPDKGHEFKRACENLGGQYILLGPSSEQNINIMDIRKTDDKATILLDGADSIESKLMRKIQQIHTFFDFLLPDINVEEKQLLDEALLKTYERFGITRNNESLWADEEKNCYKPMPILGDLHKALRELGDSAHRVYTVLSRLVSGSAANFNKPTNVDLDNKYVVLDVSRLTKEMLPLGMFIALDYVWDKAREDRTKRKAIFLDEVWELIGAGGTEQTASFVLECIKVSRGYGCSTCIATQDLNDMFALQDGKYGKAVISNSKLKLIMKLEPKEAASIKETLDLTDTEIAKCTRFNRGDGILVANTNHVVIHVETSPYERALITTSRSDLESQLNELLTG